MQALWSIEKGFVKEILEVLPAPKPHYNTVSTFIQKLEEKGFIAHKSFGKSHQYYPLISEVEYKRHFLRGFVGKYFSNSYKDLVSFFAKEEIINERDLKEILNMIYRDKKED